MGEIRADDNFDIIAAQGNSLFRWVLIRFAAVFFTISLFAALNMIIVAFVRNEMPFWEMMLTYFSPAFFFATLALLLNLGFSGEHIATLICGVVWLFTMLIQELLRFPYVEFVYLFIRYAGDKHSIWLMNKTALLLISFLLWSAVYFLCTPHAFESKKPPR